MKKVEAYRFDWAGLVPFVIHPIRVATIEAIAWIGRPLSPSELFEVFGGEWHLSLVSYHVNVLEGFGALESTGTQAVRGALQTFYFFPSAAIDL